MLSFIKKGFFWILTVAIGLLGLIFIPYVAGIFLLLVAAIILPVDKWQSIIGKYLKRPVKIILSIVLIIAFMVVAVNADIPTDTKAPIDTTVAENGEESTRADSTSLTETEKATSGETASSVKPDTKKEDTTKAPDTSKAEETTKAPEATKKEESTKAPDTTEKEESTEPETTAPAHKHKYSEATCTEPGKCSCGEITGEATGHAWKDATCSTPKTCSVCGATEGSKAAHTYSAGKCSYCGEKDPDYADETLVWIPTKGGEKYHTHAGCSNMEDPEQVTEEEAIRRGFGRCKRCH